MKVFLLLSVFLFTSQFSYGQTILAKVETLPVDSSQHGVMAYYSPGGENKAAELGPILNDALLYFNENLNKSLEFRIALLNEDHWGQMRNSPFGLPYVYGESPAVAVFPAESGGSVYEFFLTLEEDIPQSLKEEVASLGYSWEEFAGKVVDFIGFHEIGHPYAEAYGIGRSARWLNEFVASYFAYLYMYNNSPEMAKIWKLSGDIVLEVYTPKYKSLEKFNELYSRVGVPNYGWYQSAIEKRANKVVEEKGISFLDDLKKQFPEDVGDLPNEEILNRLEKIDPGFKEWSKIFE